MLQEIKINYFNEFLQIEMTIGDRLSFTAAYYKNEC